MSENKYNIFMLGYKPFNDINDGYKQIRGLHTLSGFCFYEPESPATDILLSRSSITSRSYYDKLKILFIVLETGTYAIVWGEYDDEEEWRLVEIFFSEEKPNGYYEMPFNMRNVTVLININKDEEFSAYHCTNGELLMNVAPFDINGEDIGSEPHFMFCYNNLPKEDKKVFVKEMELERSTIYNFKEALKTISMICAGANEIVVETENGDVFPVKSIDIKVNEHNDDSDDFDDYRSIHIMV